MARLDTKVARNMYYQARIEAGIRSRETAAPKLNIDPRTLANYELGTRPIPPDVVLEMAQAYERPSLVYSYCSNECPIGMMIRHDVEEKELTWAAMQTLNELRGVETVRDTLIKITADGRITEDELTDLAFIMDYFTQIEKTITELRLSLQKNIGPTNWEEVLGKKKAPTAATERAS